MHILVEKAHMLCDGNYTLKIRAYGIVFNLVFIQAFLRFLEVFSMQKLC